MKVYIFKTNYFFWWEKARNWIRLRKFWIRKKSVTLGLLDWRCRWPQVGVLLSVDTYGWWCGSHNGLEGCWLLSPGIPPELVDLFTHVLLSGFLYGFLVSCHLSTFHRLRQGSLQLSFEGVRFLLYPDPIRQSVPLLNCPHLWRTAFGYLFLQTVFRIRIHLIWIRIQHFRLNIDPDPIRIQGLYDQKFKQLQLKKN